MILLGKEYSLANIFFGKELSLAKDFPGKELALAKNSFGNYFPLANNLLIVMFIGPGFHFLAPPGDPAGFFLGSNTPDRA